MPQLADDRHACAAASRSSGTVHAGAVVVGSAAGISFHRITDGIADTIAGAVAAIRRNPALVLAERSAAGSIT
jgi:hypothetical protein